MSQLGRNCQDFLTHLRQDILGWRRSWPNVSSEPLSLSLSEAQLALAAPFLASFEHPLIVVRGGSIRELQQLTIVLNHWHSLSGVEGSWHLISNDLSEQERAGEISSSLSQTYHALLAQQSGQHFVVSEEMLERPVPARTAYQQLGLSLHTGEPWSLSKLVEALVALGYVRYEDTLEAGGVRVRGEQVDIKHPLFAGYYTVTLYRSAIENIVEHVGRRSQNVTRLAVSPMSFPVEMRPLRELLQEMEVWRPGHVDLPGEQTIIYDALQPTVEFPWRPLGETPLSARNVVAFYENRDRVAQHLRYRQVEHGLLCPSPLSHATLALANDEIAVISESYLFPKQTTRRPVSYERGRELVAELTAGKPAVHADHGIGIYEGLQQRTINDVTREYLVLQYAGGDSLSVPVEYAHKVTAYLGETTPPIAKLGGTSWGKTKQQAQRDAEAFARELLLLAAERAAAGGHDYVIDPVIEQQLEAGFPYALTPDQERTWEEVQADLVAPQPMDRLIVGDVGFGKTEIAVRAARHAAANGKQVAVLAPTTLLVQQHADTFRTRLADMKDQIVVLSRFATAKEARDARAKLASGEALIAIGTQALLSKDTTWKQLGLVVIDEEQRFGVSHKEHFKKLRADVDMLSLSATPIPRTLSMALSDLKQLSVISTAPTGRQSVRTIVKRESDEVLRQALLQELDRDGQVYVVAPKVRRLSSLAHLVQKLAPFDKAQGKPTTVAVAHGQLPPRELAKIMSRFDSGELKVLVSSSIIENGIDLANANTIIVTSATHFGLSALYQLRGRVGRRAKQGFAYFLYNQHELSGVQRQRLAALTEASRLGSGWSLAQRDLEIRGAGNLLGAEQSGTVHAIGVQLYLDMIQEAREQQETGTVRRHDVDVQLGIPSLIPPHYVADPATRTTLYQVLTRSRTPEELSGHLQRMQQQYGEMPEEVVNLEALLRLQHAAAAAGVARIEASTIRPPDEEPYERLWLSATNIPGVLQLVGNMGRWEVRDNKLTLDVERADVDLVRELTRALAPEALSRPKDTQTRLL